MGLFASCDSLSSPKWTGFAATGGSCHIVPDNRVLAHLLVKCPEEDLVNALRPTHVHVIPHHLDNCSHDPLF